MSNHDQPLTRERQYLRVQPTTDPLDPAIVERTVTELHGLGSRSNLDPPTIEVLLTATGAPGPDGDRTIDYFVGVDDTTLEDVEHVLRRCLPDSYELTEATTSYQQALELDLDPESLHEDHPIAAIEYQGVGERRGDWQTKLTPFEDFTGESTRRWPLARVAGALAKADAPILFQTVIGPKPEWRAKAENRCTDLQLGTDTPGQRLAKLLTGGPTTDAEDDVDLVPAHADRLQEICEKDSRRSFTVNARAVAIDTNNTNPTAALSGLESALNQVEHSCYHIRPSITEPDSDATATILDRLTQRTVHTTPPSRWTRLRQRLPATTNHRPEIVADPTEVGNFLLLGGPDLPAAVARAGDTTTSDDAAMQLPARQTLERYLDGVGMALGHPITADDETLDTPVTLPPDLQRLHTVIFGASGSGKTIASINAQHSNHRATDGADVVLAPKGDGMAVEYLRAHYATHGSLQNVYYFDCAETLPALSVFDIRPQLEAGIPREQAVENVVDHYTELLAGFMGIERYERAVRSPDVITYLVKALFDPVHGDDAFGHHDLERAAARMHETRDAPPVSEPRLRDKLAGVAANSQRSFDELMQGVANRIEKATRDRRLATLFDHAPDLDDTAPTTAADGGATTESSPPVETPAFDFADHLEEDCLIVLDTSGYREEARRMLTLVVLSKLWTALKRRAATRQDGDHGQVNLYVEEAADVAASGILADLLSQGRGFGLAVTLSMQFPRQLREADPRVYWELLNDVATVLVGRVGVDPDLAERLATDDQDATAVANRLRQLDRGEWLVRLPAPFGESTPRPFRCRSLDLPPGHPEGDQPFDATERELFEAALVRSKATTRAFHGLDVTATGAGTAVRDTTQSTASPTTDAPPVDSTLPYTKRLPDAVHYDSAAHAVVCSTCETRYGAHADGLRRGVDCCHDLASVDRDDVPICSIDLTLTPTERDRSDYSDRQLVFLQAVYMAHQQRFDREVAYDIVWDSMVRLQEYTGSDQAAVDELLDDELLAQDCTTPHRLYTVTAEGRSEIQEGHREGIAHGHERGDLSESSLHVMMVEVGRRHIVESFVEDPESPVVEAVRYYEADGHRYDVVGLDDDSEITVALEAERSNHDTLEAVPEDFDKMAAQDVEDALWIVKNREAAHEVLRALNEPPDGESRVAKTYSENTPPQRFTIDTPGLTEVYTLQYLRDSVMEAEPPE